MLHSVMRDGYGSVPGPSRRAGAGAVRLLALALLVVLALGTAVPRAACAAEATSAAAAETSTIPGASLTEAITDVPVADGAEEGSAIAGEAGFGITGFTRYQKGAARPVGDADLGYRYPLPAGANLVALATDETVYLYLDPTAVRDLGLDLTDAATMQALAALVCQLDAAGSRGGTTIEDSLAEKTLTVTTEPSVEAGAYRYEFRREVDGRAYCSVQPAGLAEGEAPADSAAAAGLDLSAGALWCDGGVLRAAADIAPAQTPGPLEQLAAFLSGVDLRPFWVSLKTSFVALAFTFALGLLAAWRTMGTSSRLKGLLDSVFTIPMVLPPTVCGFLLLLIFGQATPVGQWLIAHGVSLVFTWEAAVISAIVVSFPLMYRTALGAFESLDASMLDAARTLGWSEGRIFRKLMMPLAWPSIAAGTVLAFARAMGEFGCTLFFAGNYAGITQTIPIAIYFEWMSGNTDVALFWVIVVIAFSFAVVLFINLYTARSQRYRMRGGVARGRARREAAARDDAACAGAGVAAVDLLRDEPEAGGDVLRIDRDALRELLGGAPGGASASSHGNASVPAAPSDDGTPIGGTSADVPAGGAPTADAPDPDAPTRARGGR